MKKKYQRSQVFGGVAIFAFVVAMLLIIFGFSRTVGEIEEGVFEKTPEAILASAGVEEGKEVSLSVAYYDQRQDECVNMYDVNLRAELQARQFEWSGCEYYNKEIEQGLVEFELGEDYLPVAVGGRLTPNRGVSGDNFTRWFKAVDGKSINYAGLLKMNYKNDGAEFSFYQDDFYPLDRAEFSNGDAANSDGHNHLFTMDFAVPFTVLLSGEESFTITADDDTFVFVGNKLAIDMGGIHGATTGYFVIKDSGEIYTSVEGEDLAYSGITVEEGAGSIVRIFHADRDSSESVFKVKFSGMNLSVMDTKLAEQRDGDDGVQIAYDPMDPTYVAPLGESAVFRPDGTKGFIIMATVEGVLVVIFSVLIVVSVRYMIKRKVEK